MMRPIASARTSKAPPLIAVQGYAFGLLCLAGSVCLCVAVTVL